MSKSLLSGFRVVEVGQPLTEYAGLILAGFGAEVFLIEPPGGALTRQRNPRVPGSQDSGSTRSSIPFLTRNTGKRSLLLNPDNGDDMAMLTALCERSNVVLSTTESPFHDAVTESSGSATVTITDKRHLGISSIVGFAASGGLASSGWPQQPPCNAPAWLALDGTGVYAAVLALVAEIGRRRGASVHYEVPYEESAIAAVTPWTRPLHSYEMQAGGQGTVTARLGPMGFPVYEASDGYVRALAGTPRQWQALVKVLGSPEELVSGPFSEAEFRRDNIDGLYLLCSEHTRKRTVQELFHEGQRLGLTITPVYTLEQFRGDAHVQSRQILVPVQDPEFGDMEMVRPPVRIEPDDLNPSFAPAPALGEANAEVTAILAEPPLTGPDVDVQFNTVKPLDGIRVLELGFGAVVPEAAALLAGFGADVIKLESLVHVDFLRQNGIDGYMDVNNSATFNQLNLGAKSVAIDMSQPEGVEVARQLAKESDIIMDNMRGTVAQSWQLDYASSRAIRADVIYLRSQGFGRGPYIDYQTYGPNLQTFSGVTSQWAHPDDPYPVGTMLNHPDHVAGKQALVPLLAALLRREEDGSGCFVESAQVETAAYLIGDRFLQQYFRDDSLPPLGNRSLDMAPHGCYLCADDDRWIAIAVECDEQWLRLREVVGETWVEDEGLLHTSARLEHAERIDEHLAAWTKRFQVAALEKILRDAGVPASRVATGDELADDEELNSSGFFPMISHPTAGFRRYTGTPIIQTEQGRHPTRRPPLLGEHTEQVLYDVLKLDPLEVGAMMARKVVGH
ncbi:MAG: CoA transferase [Pseudomonadales bacterium]|nr:CoA transferase [Pseudomonadales bacterium]HJN52748.1 CoA transferase [Pseudomonadales bacterium]